MKTYYFIPIAGVIYIWIDFVKETDKDWLMWLIYIMYTFISLLTGLLGLGAIGYFLSK